MKINKAEKKHSQTVYVRTFLVPSVAASKVSTSHWSIVVALIVSTVLVLIVACFFFFLEIQNSCNHLVFVCLHFSFH